MLVADSLSTAEIINALREGMVGVLPTDTIYGVVCAAGNVSAVERLYALKHRDHKPGTVIAANTDQLVELGVKARYLKAVEQYWPNQISIEIPHGLAYLHQGTGRQAFRIPKHDELRTLLVQTGPLLTSSANHPGKPPANTLAEAQKYFGSKVDFYVDGGDLSGNAPSTIIRIVDDEIEVIREGAVKLDATGRILF